jgi:hypothetical protein
LPADCTELFLIIHLVIGKSYFIIMIIKKLIQIRPSSEKRDQNSQLWAALDNLTRIMVRIILIDYPIFEIP